MPDAIPTRPALPAPDVILFDLDGTLVDTVGTRVRAWSGALREDGIPVDETAVGHLIGIDGRKLASAVAAASGRTLTYDETERLDHRAGELFTDYNRDPVPQAGAREILAALDAAGLRWAIATSSRPAQVQASVDALRLDHQPLVTDGSHVEHAKPAPDLLLSAAEQVGAEPGRCWYVGDSTWDMLSARAAGMTAVGVASGASDESALREAGAHATFASLMDLDRAMVGQGLLPEEPAGPAATGS